MLIVKLIKGEELPPYRDQAPSVFMEVKLTPSMKKEFLKSDIHEMASNPNFNEQFEFGLTYEEAKKTESNLVVGVHGQILPPVLCGRDRTSAGSSGQSANGHS